MRVIMLTSFDYPHLGGVSTHIGLLAEGMRDAGATVEIVSLSSVNRCVRRALYRVPELAVRRIAPSVGYPIVTRVLTRLLTAAVRQRAESRNGPTESGVIICNDVIAAAASRGCAGWRRVLTVHGYFARELVDGGRLRFGSGGFTWAEEMERNAYGRVDGLVTVDERLRRHVHDVSGRDPVVIRNFVRSTESAVALDKQEGKRQLGLAADVPIVLCARRLVPKNGVVWALRASNLLQLRGITHRLLIVGDGPERESLRAEIQDDHVTLVGEVPHERMGAYYGCADVSVVPSIPSHGVEEATSMTALESMARMVPVVATEIGGLREIVDHGTTGLLVPATNVGCLAEAIQRLILDGEMRQRIAVNARQYVAAFHSVDSAVAAFFRLVEGL